MLNEQKENKYMYVNKEIFAIYVSYWYDRQGQV